MVRGIMYYLVIWAALSVIVYVYHHLTRSQKLSVIRSILTGLVTATIAFGLLMVIVYLF